MTNETVPNDKSVSAYLDQIQDDTKREQSYELLDIMKEVTGEEPVMWGDSIVGFGKYHYKYKSGREGDSLLAGFAPRKGKFSIYITAGFENYEKILEELGKHSKGKACLYVKNLEDVNKEKLKTLVKRSVEDTKKRYNHWKECIYQPAHTRSLK